MENTEMKRPYIIAEIAQGFEGSLELSKLLIRAAAKVNADFVKFQMVYANDLAVPKYEHYKLFQSIEFSKQEWHELMLFSQEKEIELCVDVFGSRSLEVVRSTGMRSVKIHPTDITNQVLLEELNKIVSVEQIFIGIGGAGLEEIKECINLIDEQKVIVLIHGYQAYPTPNGENKISRIAYLKNALERIKKDIKYGFADHVVSDVSKSVALNAMAYSTGAEYFEKHLSIGASVEMEDFESSIGPDDFLKFSDGLHSAAKAFGSTSNEDHFGMSKAEFNYRKNIRRNWVAAVDIQEGEVISENHVELKRSELEQDLALEEILGKNSASEIKENETITKDLIV